MPVPAPAAAGALGVPVRGPGGLGALRGAQAGPAWPRRAHSPARGHQKGEKAAVGPSSEENSVVHSPAVPEGRAGAEEVAIQAPRQRSVSWTGAPQRSQQVPSGLSHEVMQMSL